MIFSFHSIKGISPLSILRFMAPFVFFVDDKHPVTKPPTTPTTKKPTPPPTKKPTIKPVESKHCATSKNHS